MKFACDFVDELLSDFLKAEDVFVMNWNFHVRV
jgi:hypothetical protein